MAGFFKKFFAKDAGHYLEKGENLLSQNRFADAREAFSQGLECKEGLDENVKSLLQEKNAKACNALAEMNIAEGESLLEIEPDRAHDHFVLAQRLAEDVGIREKAERFLASSTPKAPEPPQHKAGHSCSGCGQGHGEKAENPTEPHDYLDNEEHYELLISALPGDLPARYRQLGKEFAEAYMIAFHGNVVEAIKVLEKLVAADENDIFLYELAVLYYRQGNVRKTEDLLRRAMKTTAINPSVVFTFAELMVETGRPAEAVPVLKEMMDQDVLPEQSALLLGDIHHVMGDTETSLEWYGQLLKTPLAKEAAKRAVPILMSCQRVEEAAFITKTYLKCC